MKKLFIFLAAIIMFAVLGTHTIADSRNIQLTNEEAEWLELHKNETLYLGLDPYSGMDYFDHRGQKKGYVIHLADLIESELGIRIEIVGDKSWGQVYDGLDNGSVDILFGANVTPERLAWMAFTEPVHRYPYAAFALKDSTVQSMGDLDGKKLGMISGDIVRELLPNEYPNVDFEVVEYDGQIEGIEALIDGEIDGFITSGGGVVYEFLFNYPQLAHIATVESITSDLTLSTRLEDSVLTGMLSKVIDKHSEGRIEEYIDKALIDYNRKILKLTDAELTWLNENGRAVVGIADNYLPFDYYFNGEYEGITGALLDEISALLGVKFEVMHGPFASMYDKALVGDVDVMNIAKTEARSEFFYYPRPFSTERDIIVGLKSSERVHDVYGLNGKRIAVVEGYWHEEFIRKNLKDVEIIITGDLIESLKLVRSRHADYMIENPTVLEYYIDGLGYNEIVKKGDTSKDSYLYLGVSKRNPELAGIIDKAIMIIDYEDVKFKGIDSSPVVRNEQNVQLMLLVAVLIVILIIMLLYLNRVFQALIAEKANTQLLKEREKLIYTDALTELSNRMHFNHLEAHFDSMAFPQCVFIADLNNLKKFNDSYGHHLGDVLLQSFADILKETTNSEYIFRMGGDEFMVVKYGCDVLTAEEVIHTIQDRCKHTDIATGTGHFENPEAAYGFSIRISAEESLESVIIKADNEMYKHKTKLKRISSNG